jgi:RecB family exonuclease
MKKKKLGFNPQDAKPFKLSRSKIELYHECPCCFYLDRKLGIAPPGGFPFNLNNAVDELLKKEFDSYRESKIPHPLLVQYGIDAIPFQHDELKVWRKNLKGITFLHAPTQFLVTGAVDDIWINSLGELIVIDFKATSKNDEVNINADWQLSYKRQMEVYQWLLRRNGFAVSNIGYFLYCNGKKDRPTFQGRLEFDISLIPYQGDDKWIETTLQKIHACLSSENIPDSVLSCKLCQYRLSVQGVFLKISP